MALLSMIFIATAVSAFSLGLARLGLHFTLSIADRARPGKPRTAE